MNTAVTMKKMSRMKTTSNMGVKSTLAVSACGLWRLISFLLTWLTLLCDKVIIKIVDALPQQSGYHKSRDD
jgi:hypothetical protein